MKTFYIAATNVLSWGKGYKVWEAVGNAIEYGGHKVEEVVIFELECPDDMTLDNLSVNEMGSIVAPKKIVVKQIADFKAAELRAKFFSYRDLLNISADL